MLNGFADESHKGWSVWLTICFVGLVCENCYLIFETLKRCLHLNVMQVFTVLALHHTRPVAGPRPLVLGWCCDLVLAFGVRSRRMLV